MCTHKARLFYSASEGGGGGGVRHDSSVSPTTARVSTFFATFVLLGFLNVCVLKEAALAVWCVCVGGGRGCLNCVCSKGWCLGRGGRRSGV